MSGATTLGSIAREDPCNVTTMRVASEWVKSADARTSVEKRHSGEAGSSGRSVTNGCDDSGRIVGHS